MVGHALSSLLKRLGFAGFLASAIAFIVKFLVSNEASPSLGKMVLPAGTESGQSSSSGSWRQYINFSADSDASSPTPGPQAPSSGTNVFYLINMC